MKPLDYTSPAHCNSNLCISFDMAKKGENLGAGQVFIIAHLFCFALLRQDFSLLVI